MSLTRWHEGHRVELLENGEQFYPSVLAAIDAAEREVLLETFILLDDPGGQPLQKAVIAAAQRGVSVQMTLDGWGSATLPQSFIEPMIAAGVRIHIYDPVTWRFGQRTQIFHRLHRKLIVIDQRVAWCGGINFSHDHLRDFGALSKQDYALEIEGPVVADIYRAMRIMLPRAARPKRPPRQWRRKIF